MSMNSNQRNWSLKILLTLSDKFKMRNLVILLFLGCFSTLVQGQELNATVTIDAEQTGQPNAQVFRTLKDQLTELLNETQWTNRTFTNQERIDCNFTLILQSFESPHFQEVFKYNPHGPFMVLPMTVPFTITTIDNSYLSILNFNRSYSTSTTLILI